MLFDRTHPCHPIRNFDFVISIDAIRMKSYVDGFFNPTCVTVRTGTGTGPASTACSKKPPNSESKQAVYLFHAI